MSVKKKIDNKAGQKGLTDKKKKTRNMIIGIGVAAAVLIVITVIVLSSVLPVVNYSNGFEILDLKSGLDWQIYNYRSEHESSDVTEISLVEGKEGSGKCLKIHSKSLNDARIHKEFKVSPSSFYKITLSIKTENVNEGAGANLSGYNMSGTALKTTGTTDWTTRSIFLETGEDQKVIDLSLGLGGYGSESSGTAYFDNLSIVKVSASEVGEGTVTLKLTPSGSDKKTPEVSVWFKLLFVLVVLSAIAFCFISSVRNDKSGEISPLLSPEGTGKFKKRDVIIVLSMTVVTMLISFIGMGSTSGTPNTYWQSESYDEYVTISFKETKQVSRFVFYGGISKSGGVVRLQYYDAEKGEFVSDSATITKDDVPFYRWGYKNVNFKTDKIRIYIEKPGLWLNEVGFFEKKNGEFVAIELDTSTVESSYTRSDSSGQPEFLFDEQSELRTERSYYDSTYFDEIYHPRTAFEQIHGLSIYERTHPPLGKIIMEIGILIFGMNSFGWRFSGVLFGALLVPLIYAFALKLFKKSEWAFVAAFLMMFDFMRLAQTRLATIDTYACFFSVAMMYFMYDYYSVKSYERGFKKSLIPLFLSGLMFGMGAASKWTCIYTGAGLAVVFFIAKIREYLDVRAGRAYEITAGTNKRRRIYTGEYVNKNLLPTLGLCVLFFVIIPATVYCLSYLPYMPSNPGKSLLQVVIDNQKYMYNYHSKLDSTHSYSSMWYTWPLMVRPIWYYVGYGVPEGMRSTISSFGNPAIWWPGIPCLFGSCYLAWRNKDFRMGFMAVAFASAYAPWILVNRVCFIYHYFTAFAFSIFFIVYVLKELTEKKVMPKFVNFIYLGIVVILFIIFYPVLTGLPVSKTYVDALKWFSTWSF